MNSQREIINRFGKAFIMAHRCFLPSEDISLQIPFITGEEQPPAGKHRPVFLLSRELHKRSIAGQEKSGLSGSDLNPRTKHRLSIAAPCISGRKHLFALHLLRIRISPVTVHYP